MRPLINGPISPPLRGFSRRPDPMRHQFTATPLAPGVGVANIAYTTYAAAPVALVGAGTGIKNSPIGPGRPPMIARPRVTVMGLASMAGQFVSTPLSDPVE